MTSGEFQMGKGCKECGYWNGEHHPACDKFQPQEEPKPKDEVLELMKEMEDLIEKHRRRRF